MDSVAKPEPTASDSFIVLIFQIERILSGKISFPGKPKPVDFAREPSQTFHWDPAEMHGTINGVLSRYHCVKSRS